METANAWTSKVEVELRLTVIEALQLFDSVAVPKFVSNSPPENLSHKNKRSSYVRLLKDKARNAGQTF